MKGVGIGSNIFRAPRRKLELGKLSKIRGGVSGRHAINMKASNACTYYDEGGTNNKVIIYSCNNLTMCHGWNGMDTKNVLVTRNCNKRFPYFRNLF